MDCGTVICCYQKAFFHLCSTWDYLCYFIYHAVSYEVGLLLFQGCLQLFPGISEMKLSGRSAPTTLNHFSEDVNILWPKTTRDTPVLIELSLGAVRENVHHGEL